MRSIHDKEEDIFKKYLLLENNQEISKDGLHYLGEFKYENECWKREKGDEEERWNEVCTKKRGLVVITKDLNDEEAWDIRAEHGRENGHKEPIPCKQYKFYRNLRCWIYGLLNISKEGLMPNYPTTPDIPQKCFETEPWVRINLKKIPGCSSIKERDLVNHIETHKPLLLEQLKIYKDASIYLDCAARNGINLLKEISQDIKSENNWISFSEKHSFIVINTYHPSYRRIREKAYYGDMRDASQSFFNKKDFSNIYL